MEARSEIGNESTSNSEIQFLSFRWLIESLIPAMQTIVDLCAKSEAATTTTLKFLQTTTSLPVMGPNDALHPTISLAYDLTGTKFGENDHLL